MREPIAVPDSRDASRASRHVLGTVLVLAAALSVPAAGQQRKTITLQWDANTERDLAGYVVMIGSIDGAAEQQVNVGNVTRFAYDVVIGQRQYVWVHAYNLAGMLSPPSNSVEVLVPVPESSLPAVPADRMSAEWAAQFGVTDPAADPDGDGVTNLDEFKGGTDPRLPNRWYFPDGASGSFTARLALVNPGATSARGTVVVRQSSGERSHAFLLAPRTRQTLEMADMVGSESRESYTTVVNVTEGGVAAERTMRWNARSATELGHGHTGRGLPRLSREWFFAEGDTRGFDTVLVLANEADRAATVTVEFVRADGVTVMRSYSVPAVSRTNVLTSAMPELAYVGFWMRVSSDVPIGAERAMYLKPPFRTRLGGHVTAGVTAPSSTWYFAEGVTGSYYDAFLVLANPSMVAATVEVTWFRTWLPPLTEIRVVPARGKSMIAVESSPGLSATPFSAALRSSQPIVAERAMYWRGGPTSWTEGHVSTGMTQPGTTWVLAEGEQADVGGYETRLSVVNAGTIPATAKFTFLMETGSPMVGWRTIPPQSRIVVDSRLFVPGDGRFGVLIESDAPVAVERSMSWVAEGSYAGGSNETGFRMR